MVVFMAVLLIMHNQYGRPSFGDGARHLLVE
jgi:hypothetical protein